MQQDFIGWLLFESDWVSWLSIGAILLPVLVYAVVVADNVCNKIEGVDKD